MNSMERRNFGVMRRALLAFVASMLVALVACGGQAPGQPVAELRSPIYLASDISPEHTDAVVAAVAAAGDAEACSVSVAYDQVDPVIVAARGQAECVATVRLRRDMTAAEVEQAVTDELRAMRDEAETLWIDPAIGDQRKCDATCPVDRGLVARARFRDGAECGVHVRAGDGGTWQDGCRTIVEVPASVGDVCGYVVAEMAHQAGAKGARFGRMRQRRCASCFGRLGMWCPSGRGRRWRDGQRRHAEAG